jgi:hypothetical protein
VLSIFRGQQQALAANAGKRLRKQSVRLALDPSGVGESQGMTARWRRRGQCHGHELLLVIRHYCRHGTVIQLHLAQRLIERIKDDGGGRGAYLQRYRLDTGEAAPVYIGHEVNAVCQGNHVLRQAPRRAIEREWCLRDCRHCRQRTDSGSDHGNRGACVML